MPSKGGGLIWFRSNTPKLKGGERTDRYVVYQYDIETIFAYEREIDCALEVRDFQRAEQCLSDRLNLWGIIEARLRAGARVEQGAHDARLVADLARGELKLQIW